VNLIQVVWDQVAFDPQQLDPEDGGLLPHFIAWSFVPLNFLTSMWCSSSQILVFWLVCFILII
jgi:hypothetical protein